MSEDDASAPNHKDPAEVWCELDDDTRERVIEMFVDMAFRVVHNQLQSPIPEDDRKAARSR